MMPSCRPDGRRIARNSRKRSCHIYGMRCVHLLLAHDPPEIGMFGAALPAYGFFCRNVNGLAMRDILLRTQEPDLRPALFCGAVTNLDVSGLDASSWPGAEAIISLRQVQDAFIHACQLVMAVDTFIKLDGDKCETVTVMGNCLARVKNVAATTAGVPEGVLSLIGNRMPENPGGS